MGTVFVYSEGCCADIGAHVFPVEKYRLVYQQLRAQGIIDGNLVEPAPASETDLLLAHNPDYVNDLIQALSTERTASSELPISKADKEKIFSGNAERLLGLSG